MKHGGAVERQLAIYHMAVKAAAQEGREGSDFLGYQLQDVRRCIPDSLVFNQRTLE
jgi:hypothetical protein